MSYTIVYQSMSIVFPNGNCFVLTQDGASNSTDINILTGREVISKDWHTHRLCRDSQGNYLNKASVLEQSIKATFMEFSNNNLASDSGMAYKTRLAFKPYSFWVNHFTNALKRYRVSAETFIRRFNFLYVNVLDVKPDVTKCISTVEDLYNLFLEYPGKQFSFQLPRDLMVSSLVTHTRGIDKQKTKLYYVYSVMENGIYCKQIRRNSLTMCCFNSTQPYKSYYLTEEVEQYLLRNYGIKSVLLFKSLPACISFFLERKSIRASYLYIGVYGQQNTPSSETLLENYLKKSINYKG